jgi:hypothetical protein
VPGNAKKRCKLMLNLMQTSARVVFLIHRRLPSTEQDAEHKVLIKAVWVRLRVTFFIDDNSSCKVASLDLRLISVDDN